MRERADLPGDSLDQDWMRMAQRADGDTADQVQVGVPVNVPDHAAGAAGQRYRRHSVGQHHARAITVLQQLSR